MVDIQTVLIVGGTGHLGNQVVKAAVKNGYTVKALVRPESSAHALAEAGVQVVRGDMLDRGSLDKALQGCQVRRRASKHRSNAISMMLP